MAIVGALSLSLTVAPAAVADSAEGSDASIVAHYNFTDGNGDRVRDLSGTWSDAEIIGEPTWGAGYYAFAGQSHMKLPDDLLKDKDSATIVVETLPDEASLSGNNFLWNIGGTASTNEGTGQFFLHLPGKKLAITKTNWSGEVAAKYQDVSAIPSGQWSSVAATIAPNEDGATSTLVLFINGVEVARNDNSSVNLRDLANHSNNLLGGSAYAADAKYRGGVADLRIYDAALTPEQAQSIAAETAADVAEAQIESLSLGDTIGLRANIDLPTNGGITWESSDPSVINAEGRVFPGNGEQYAVLTATINVRGETARKDFEVTVAAAASETDLAQQDLNAIEIPDSEAVRGNITLPSVGIVNESPISWESSDESIISTKETEEIPAGVVTRPEVDTQVVLTATVAGTEARKEITVTVLAAPENLDTDYNAGYLWSHFAVEDGYERIFFGFSDDGLHWEKLNDNKSILSNLGGDLGVRDPHIIRSAEGDRYWIIGTDLHAEGSGSGGSGWDQMNASQNLVVWESTDLVNWSDQRIVFAGFDDAGCVWAPEAFYDDISGQYYVYWAARDRKDANSNNWALRVYLTKTRDFRSFTEPEVWLDYSNSSTTNDGPNIIDTSIAKEGDTYYRFSTSDWRTVVDTATSLDGPWVNAIALGEDEAHGLSSRMEGITVYQLPDGRWALMGDNSGYKAFVTDSLASLQFTPLSVGPEADQFSFDEKFRHGTVLRLSQAEQDRILAAYANSDPEEPQVPEEEQDAPIAEYTFDDDSLKDSRGDNDLTAHGTASVTEDAERGKVLTLDGESGNYASFPKGFFDGRDTMTVSMDVKSELSSGNFFSFAFGQNDQKYYFLRARGGELRSAITQASWNSESAVAGSIPSGVWNNVKVVFAGDVMKVYVNGMLLGEETISTSVSDLGTDVLGYLGRSFYSGDRYFKGSFDNIKIYNRVLSDAELTEGAPLVSSARLGTIPEDPESTQGTDDHTAVVSHFDSDGKTVTSYVRKSADLSALPTSFVVGGSVSILLDDEPFENGSIVDYSQGDQSFTFVREGDNAETETWLVKPPLQAGNPVLPGQYADPDIDILDGKFWIFPTTDGYSGWGGSQFHAWSSENLVDWVDEGVILDVKDKNPGVNAKGVQIASVPWANGNGWAPTIEEKNGKFYFYFSGHYDAQNAKAIGVAVADSPAGPYVAQSEPLITVQDMRDQGISLGQAIDPSIFTDEDGTSYVLFGNGNPVKAELAEDMVSLVPGTAKNISGLQDFRESVVVTKIGDTYHWTWSVDDTGSPNYRVYYGTSTSLNDAVEYHYPLLQKDESAGILGTAHQSVLSNGNDYYIAYHRFYTPLGVYTSGLGYHRETSIDVIELDENGRMRPVTPTMEGVAATSVYQVPAETTPSIALSTQEITAGETLTVTGSNWAPEEEIAVSLGSSIVVLDAGVPPAVSVQASAEGTFSVEIVLPGSLSAGPYRVVATGSEGVTVSSGLTVKAKDSSGGEETGGGEEPGGTDGSHHNGDGQSDGKDSPNADDSDDKGQGTLAVTGGAVGMMVSIMLLATMLGFAVLIVRRWKVLKK